MRHDPGTELVKRWSDRTYAFERAATVPYWDRMSAKFNERLSPPTKTIEVDGAVCERCVVLGPLET